MRKFTFTFSLLLLSVVASFAAPPTVPASNLQFPAANLEGNRFTMSFNKGNGAFRIIVVKEGSALTTLPVNGTDYSANAAFGTSGTAFAAGDGFVVYKGSTSVASFSVTVTNLEPGKIYFASIFEFNGSGAASEFLTVPLSGSVSTKSAPTTQATINSFTAVTGNKLTVNWSGGNGERKLLIARKSAPVNATPQQLVDYLFSPTFGSGAVINGDNYVVYKGQGVSANVTSLDPNTTYHFAIFEYNGNNYPVYLTPGGTGSRTTNAGPSQASGTISFSSIEGNRLTLTFGPGNGRYQMIIARKGQAPTAQPANGEIYEPNTAFGAGEQIAPGEFVMATTTNDRTFTNLDIASNYFFRVYDFDMDADGNTFYYTAAYSQNSQSTASAPTGQVSNVRFENISGTSLTIRHDAGSSAYRLVVMRLGAPVDATPVDLVRYTGNTSFGFGSQITTGNYVITGGQNSTAATVTNLVAGQTYHVAVFGFNGNNYPVYAIPGATASITIPNEPTAAATGWQTSSVQGNSVRAQWTGGDGGRRLVIGRKGAAVTATPADGTTYTAGLSFGTGTEVSAGQFVVYDGTNRNMEITNLEIGSDYHFAVFEYNSASGNPDYLISSKLTGSATTLSAPTQQTSGLSASAIQPTQAQINFAAGNGSGRIIVMRASTPVNAEPVDLETYSFSNSYGSVELGSGNYIVLKTIGTANFTASSLTPNTQYFVAAFEYNGGTGPVYLKPAATFSFTTTAAADPAPTVNSSNPQFTPDGNKIKLQVQEGNGAKRLIIARQGSAVNFTPANGMEYAGNAAFGQSTDLGGGQFAVYSGNTNNVTITNLSPANTYHFAVYEFNGTGASVTYLLTNALQANQSTASTPAAGSTNISGAASGNTINLNWASGPGTGRIIVMKEGSAVTGTPADLSKYPASNVFGSGAQIGTGEYVVYSGNGNSTTVTGLGGNRTYHFTIFEFNGADAPIYNIADRVSNSTTMPIALPLQWLYITAKEINDKVELNWGVAEEFNTSHFIIERSVANEAFQLIATIQAAGSGTNHYSHIDNDATSGIVSYRIKQVDTDGRFAYSKQVVVRVAASQGALRLYPNPAAGQARVSLPQGIQQAGLNIYSMEGRLVKSQRVSNGELLMLNIPGGVYQVVIVEGGIRYSTRLVKQ